MSRQQRGQLQRKLNSELFTLTYGAFVAQLVRDNDNDVEVNKQLEKIGFNMGLRLAEDYLFHSSTGRCADLRDVAEALAKGALKHYLGITANVVNWSTAGDAFSLLLESNPLADLVELPPSRSGVIFSNVLAGAIRGALETIQLEVECTFVGDPLRSSQPTGTELRVRLLRRLDQPTPGDAF